MLKDGHWITYLGEAPGCCEDFGPYGEPLPRLPRIDLSAIRPKGEPICTGRLDKLWPDGLKALVEETGLDPKQVDDLIEKAVVGSRFLLGNSWQDAHRPLDLIPPKMLRPPAYCWRWVGDGVFEPLSPEELEQLKRQQVTTPAMTNTDGTRVKTAHTHTEKERLPMHIGDKVHLHCNGCNKNSLCQFRVADYDATPNIRIQNVNCAVCETCQNVCGVSPLDAHTVAMGIANAQKKLEGKREKASAGVKPLLAGEDSASFRELQNNQQLKTQVTQTPETWVETRYHNGAGYITVGYGKLEGSDKRKPSRLTSQHLPDAFRNHLRMVEMMAQRAQSENGKLSDHERRILELISGYPGLTHNLTTRDIGEIALNAAYLCSRRNLEVLQREIADACKDRDLLAEKVIGMISKQEKGVQDLHHRLTNLTTVGSGKPNVGEVRRMLDELEQKVLNTPGFGVGSLQREVEEIKQKLENAVDAAHLHEAIQGYISAKGLDNQQAGMATREVVQCLHERIQELEKAAAAPRHSLLDRFSQVFYAGLAGGIAFSAIGSYFPEYVIPSLITFAGGTGLHSFVTRFVARQKA